MKKLLITTMAAVSVGLCAKAEGAIDASTFTENDTSFEGLATGNFSFDNNYWSNPTNQDDEFKIIEAVYPDGVTKQHWAWTDGAEKALSIDTANPILRNVNPVSNGNPPLNVSTTPVFFDSVVQFTATDVAPVVDTLSNKENKLMVWLYMSPDDVSGTNPGLFKETAAKKTLVITAGVIEKNGDTENLVQKNYDTGIEIEPESWHRLTIKSFLNEEKTKLMFNVWIDGAKDPITAEGVTDFLSMVRPDGASDIYLQGVAFDGKGVVDDIVFTTTAPGFAGEDTYAITTAGENATITVLDSEGNELDAGKLDVEITTVGIAVAPTSGYVLQSAIFNGNAIEELPPFDSSTKDYYFEINVPNTDGVVAKGSEFAFSVVMVANSGVVTVGSTTVQFDNNGEITNITTANNGQAVSGELDTMKFKSYYTAKVENGILSIKLDQKAAAPFAEATDLEDGKEVLEVGEDASGNPKLTVRIKPYVGLYYGAMTGASLDNLTLTSAGYQEATTTGVMEFTATGKAGDTAGFIKVVVTDIAPEE